MGGCHTRWSSEQGLCSGVKTAEWLNSLGDDDAVYGKFGLASNKQTVTIGEVRRNWLRGDSHIMLVDERGEINYLCPHCDGTGRITFKP